MLYTLSRKRYMVLAAVCPVMMELFYEMLRPNDGLHDWLQIEEEHREEIEKFHNESLDEKGKRDEMVIRLTRTASTEAFVKSIKKQPKIKRSVSKGLKKKFDLELREG